MMENIEELELAEGGVVLHAAALCWLTRKVTLGRCVEAGLRDPWPHSVPDIRSSVTSNNPAPARCRETR